MIDIYRENTTPELPWQPDFKRLEVTHADIERAKQFLKDFIPEQHPVEKWHSGDTTPGIDPMVHGRGFRLFCDTDENTRLAVAVGSVLMGLSTAPRFEGSAARGVIADRDIWIVPDSKKSFDPNSSIHFSISDAFLKTLQQKLSGKGKTPS